MALRFDMDDNIYKELRAKQVQTYIGRLLGGPEGLEQYRLQNSLSLSR